LKQGRLLPYLIFEGGRRSMSSHSGADTRKETAFTRNAALRPGTAVPRA